MAAKIGRSPELIVQDIVSRSMRHLIRKNRTTPPRAYIDLTQVSACYARGLDKSETAKQLGFAVATVERASRRAGVRWKRRGLMAEAALTALADRCATAHDIAKIIGCTGASALQTLYRLEDAGKVRRAGTQERLVRGRPHLRWRRVEGK